MRILFTVAPFDSASRRRVPLHRDPPPGMRNPVPPRERPQLSADLANQPVVAAAAAPPGGCRTPAHRTAPSSAVLTSAALSTGSMVKTCAAAGSPIAGPSAAAKPT